METDYKAFFAARGLDALVRDADDSAPVAELDSITPMPPDLTDLHSLYSLIEKTGRTTILEFGCGWSSLVMAAALAASESQIGRVPELRRHDLFRCHSVDNLPHFIEVAQARIPDRYRDFIQFHRSPVRMTVWNGRYASEYETLPLVNPDFIYLDGPDPTTVQGAIDGWSTRHPDMMPMACDVLKFEHFLLPKTIIVVDGRAANARFLKSQLERNWAYKYCAARDQHFFLLEEPPLGKFSAALIDKVYYRNGRWSIEDL